jgi:hypothetical protein
LASKSQQQQQQQQRQYQKGNWMNSVHFTSLSESVPYSYLLLVLDLQILRTFITLT